MSIAARERPIIFSAPMVRAIQADRKTQTRRVVKPQPPANYNRHCWWDAPIYGFTCEPEPAAEWSKVRCPYGVPGDRLWVKERFALVWLYRDHEAGYTEEIREWVGLLPTSPPEGWRIWYAADDDRLVKRCRSPLFMPRWASRLTLEITDIRVQRLREITEDDAKAEGMEPAPGTYTADFALHGYVDSFVHTWDRINAKRGFPWDANPWVWAITFRREESSHA